METKFKGSQSFTLRSGWVQKALIEIKNRPDVNVFSKKDGVIYLGLGSNMVTSLKYWLNTAGITDISKKKNSQLSSFGELIYKYDQYLETPFVWQLIHLQISSNKYMAPLFWFLFNRCRSGEIFTKDSFCEDYTDFAKVGNTKVNQNYVSDDFSVLVRSYISTEKSDPEDNMDCPLSELSLLVQGGRGQFKKTPIGLDVLDPRIVFFQLRAFAKKKDSVAFEDFVDSEDGPCRSFNLDRSSLMTVLGSLSNAGYLTITRTAGLNVMYLNRKTYNMKDLFSDVFGGQK
jgi:hypothetical protein